VNNLSNTRAPDAFVEKLLRNVLLGSACLAGLMTVPAVAQTGDQAVSGGEVETVVVTGIIGSLQRDLDIKRDAAGLVDAISMEDIGKFPDSNLANALMRIPGVTTSITSNTTNNGQAVTTGAGVTISVRGFGPSFNETLFDGRIIPSAISASGTSAGGRSFDFSGLSADMVSQLQVLKSPDATLSAGAIGATVNVIFPKPFDKPGLTVAAAAATDEGADDGRWRPNGNFLISDTFYNDKLGILVAGAYSDLSTSQQQAQNWGWIGQYCTAAINAECDPTSPSYNSSIAGQPIWWTQDYAVDFNRVQDEHINGRVAFQYQPTDALVLTLDGNYARDDLNVNSLTYALWNGVSAMTNMVRASDGTITQFNREAPTDFDDVISQSVQQTYNWGLNGKWTVDDHITAVADFDQALSSLNPGKKHFSEVSEDLGYGSNASPCSNLVGSADYDPNCAVANYTGGTNSMNFSVTQPGGHALPYYGGIGPNGDLANFYGYNVGANGIVGSHVMMVIQNLNRTLVNDAKLETDLTYDNLVIKIGVQDTSNNFWLYQNVDHWDTNNEWQSYAGYGPDSNNYYYGNPNAAEGVHIPASLFTGIRPMRSIPGWSAPTGGLIPGLPVFNAYKVFDYINSLGTSVTCSSAKPGGPAYVPSINGFSCGGVYNPATFTGTLPQNMVQPDPNGFQHVVEDDYAGYLSFAAQSNLAGMPLKINGGVRYEYTDVTTAAIGRNVTSIVVSPADPTAYQFYYGPQTTIVKKNSYAYLLPNIDLNLFVTDDLHLRFDASRTMTRPPLADLKGNFSYNGRVGSLGATGGNPYELPYLSDNMDVSAEWYYATNSYLSADLFLKDVSNWIVAGDSTITVPGVLGTLPGVPGTGTANFTLQSNANAQAADIYGLEVTWQHLFGDTGFGYLINGTLVGTNKPYNPNNLSVGNFAMTGLADSANLMAFYEKNGLEVRLAANWRDEYLDKFGQGQFGGTQFGSEPIFINGSWNLTLSTSYDITDNIRAYFEADNLTDAAYSSRGRFGDQLYTAITVGRRFTIGVHYKL
jgi:TonB-dependent receptor